MSEIQFRTLNCPAVEAAVVLSAASAAPWTEPHWYAVQTVARHEKAVVAQLTGRGVEMFLPLQIVMHKWGDRKVVVELPLFTCYVFAHIPYLERLSVLKANGVLRMVSFNGLPSPVDDEEIEALRRASGLPLVEPHEFLTVGQRVRINSGAFEGLEGIVVRQKNSIRLIVSVQAIQQSIAVEISAADLQSISYLPVATKFR
jgi:transcription antitermination factor NusG